MKNDHNILLSKILTNATETTWAQAYTTLNFYIALSIEFGDHQKEEGEGKEKEPIAVFGKEILERIQREFFALDEKTLDSVKKAVETVVENIPKDTKYSIVLATIVKDMLYIVIGSGGHVIIKRNDKIGNIATGEEGKVTAFSGLMQSNDVVILETESFAKKISIEKISTVLDNSNVSEISEKLAPLIHDEANGTEAAIVLQYASNTPAQDTIIGNKEEKDDDDDDDDKKEKEHEDDDNKEDDEEKREEKEEPILSPVIEDNKSEKRQNEFLKKLSGKKKVIIIGIVILVIVLGISIFFETNRREGVKRATLYTEKVVPLEKQYDEATALTGLNKAMGLDSLNSIKSDLATISFPKGSTEDKKTKDFLDKVVKKIAEFEAASSLTNEKVFFDPASEDIKSVGAITQKGAALSAINSDTGTATILDKDGEISKTLKNDIQGVTNITADTTNIYALSDDGILKIDKKSGKKTVIASSATGTDIAGIDTFLGNVYALNTKTETIDKYASGSTTRTAYFTDSSITLSSPSSFSIDSSIWVLEDSGKIRKFTKGKEDTFTMSGLSKPIGTGASIYTDEDYSSIYILDPKNNRLLDITKTGELKNQYASKEFANTSSFAVDETGKKVYFVLSGKISSFDLQ